MISLHTGITQMIVPVMSRPAEPGPVPGAALAWFGSLTPAGLGGIAAPGAAAVVSGDPFGHWQILAGRLAPSATGAGQLAGRYDLELDTGQVIAVEIEPGAAHIAPEGATGCDQLTRYIDANAPDAVDWSGGGTLYLRPGTYDTRAAYGGDNPADARMMGTFHLAMGVTTIRSADPENMAHLTGYVIGGAQQVSGITLRGLRITGEQSVVGTFDGPVRGLPVKNPVAFQNAANCAVIDCEIAGDLRPFDEGGASFDTMTGVAVDGACSFIEIRNNRIHSLHKGIACSGTDCTIEDNELSLLHSDIFSLGFAAHRSTIQRNVSFDVVGDPTYRHADLLQCDNRNAAPLEDLVFAGNVHWFGAGGRSNARQGDSFDGVRTVFYSNDAALLTTKPSWIEVIGDAITLDQTLVGVKIVVVPADGTTIKVNLPDAASNAGKVWCIEKQNKDVTATVVFQLAGADTHAEALPTMTGNTSKFSFRSDGTSQWKSHFNGMFYFEIPLFASTTLQDWRKFRGTLVDTTAGDVTVTIPAGQAGDKFNIRRIYPGTNAARVQSSGGELFTFDDGSTGTSFDLALGDSRRIEWNGATWNVIQRTASNQIIFANGSCTRAIIRGNAVAGRASAGVTWEQGITDSLIVNNTLISQPDITDMRPYGTNIRVNGAGTIAYGNICSGAVVLQDGGLAHNNIEMNVNDDTGFSALYAQFGGTTVDDLIPGDFAEAVQFMRPRAGTDAAMNFAGALGLDGASGALDASTLTLNPDNYPVPVADSFEPLDGSTIGASAPVTVVFSDFVAFGTGAITLWNEAEAQAVATFDVATSPQVSITGRVLTITPSSALPGGATISVRIDATAIISRTYGTSFAGLSGDTLSYVIDDSALSAWPKVSFDGASFMMRDPHGDAVQSTKFVLAMRYARAGSSGARQTFVYRGDARLVVLHRQSSNRFAIKLFGSDVAWTNVDLTDGVDYTILATLDTAQADPAAGCRLYINGVDYGAPSGSWSQGDEINLQNDLILFNNNDQSGRAVNGEMGMFYMDRPIAAVPDLSDPAVRSLFDPANLSLDPAAPTGRIPEILMHGDAASWNMGLNQGSAGDFAVIGGFGAA